tara:strand:+ start:133 stop:1281 length:1149 start_codon:yes stop_codon:yes gene_type:complete
MAYNNFQQARSKLLLLATDIKELETNSVSGGVRLMHAQYPENDIVVTKDEIERSSAPYIAKKYDDITCIIVDSDFFQKCEDQNIWPEGDAFDPKFFHEIVRMDAAAVKAVDISADDLNASLSQLKQAQERFDPVTKMQDSQGDVRKTIENIFQTHIKQWGTKDPQEEINLLLDFDNAINGEVFFKKSHFEILDRYRDVISTSHFSENPTAFSVHDGHKKYNFFNSAAIGGSDNLELLNVRGFAALPEIEKDAGHRLNLGVRASETVVNIYGDVCNAFLHVGQDKPRNTLYGQAPDYPFVAQDKKTSFIFWGDHSAAGQAMHTSRDMQVVDIHIDPVLAKGAALYITKKDGLHISEMTDDATILRDAVSKALAKDDVHSELSL